MQKVRFAAPMLAALALATTAQTSPPVPPPDVRAAFLNPAFVVSSSCKLNELAILRVLVTNPGSTTTAPFVISAGDERTMLEGFTQAPALPGGGIAQTDISLRRVGTTAPEKLGGAHLITVYSRGRIAPITVNVLIPAGLCNPGVAAVADTQLRYKLATPTPKPGVETVMTNRGPNLGALLTPAAPANLHGVSDKRDDCAPHVGLLGALVCPDMMKSGDLLLIWDFQPGNGADIDGYRIYRVVPTRALIGTQTNKATTLYDVAKPASGKYDGLCYTVTAYAGKFESTPSNQFCAGATSAAKTTTFTPFQEVSVTRHSIDQHEKAPQRETTPYHTVGYNYGAVKGGIFADGSFAWISRYAMLFNVKPLLGRKAVEAHLTLKVLPNAINAPNCANSVGIGTADWWADGRWPDGFFTNDAPTQVGNELRIDLTNTVQNWMNGRFNQGIILRNSDENLNAFTSKRCTTYYMNPVLSVTYY